MNIGDRLNIIWKLQSIVPSNVNIIFERNGEGKEEGEN